MIEMADDEPPIAEIDKLMQQGDGIAAAGNADEIAAVGGNRARIVSAIRSTAGLRFHQASASVTFNFKLNR